MRREEVSQILLPPQFAHDLLQRGQSAAEVFAMLFAKQRKGVAA